MELGLAFAHTCHRRSGALDNLEIAGSMCVHLEHGRKATSGEDGMRCQRPHSAGAQGKRDRLELLPLNAHLQQRSSQPLLATLPQSRSRPNARTQAYA
jgi:hypothetical protein